MENRRAHPRFPLVVAVQYLGAESVLDYSENLSASGLFVCTEQEFQPGERVTLVLSFPQLLEPVELEVEVLRRRKPSAHAPAGVAVRVPDDRLEDRVRLAEATRIVAGARGGEARFRILLVEDNALVASVYAAALRRLSDTDPLPGLGIEIASDGAAAFARLLETPRIDLVITDLFMPVLSGIPLVERIRSEPALANLPVVVITSAGEPERVRLAELGVTRFLRKPVSYRAIASTIRSILDAREPPPSGAGCSPAPAIEEPRGEELTDGFRVGKTELQAKPASSR